VQKGPLPGLNDKMAFVDTNTAIHITIAQSTAALSQVNQQLHEATLTKMQEVPMATPELAASGHTR